MFQRRAISESTSANDGRGGRHGHAFEVVAVFADVVWHCGQSAGKLDALQGRIVKSFLVDLRYTLGDGDACQLLAFGKASGGYLFDPFWPYKRCEAGFLECIVSDLLHM